MCHSQMNSISRHQAKGLHVFLHSLDIRLINLYDSTQPPHVIQH